MRWPWGVVGFAVAGCAVVAASLAVATRCVRDVPPTGSADAARSVLAAHTTRLHALETSAAELSGIRSALDVQAARIAQIETGPISIENVALTSVDSARDGPAQSAKLTIEALKAIPDGNRVVAIRDGVASLVRCGDAAVPEILALLQSGIERQYGVGLVLEGDSVMSYPGLRLVLMDVLRQIGTPASRQALAQALEASDRIEDLPVMWLLTTRGKSDPDDPALVSALSRTASAALRKLTPLGLESIDCDTSSGPGISLVSWMARHPVADDADALDTIVARGRPKTGAAAEVYRRLLPVLVQVAPEKAAREALESSPGFGLVALSEQFRDVSRTSEAQYYEALFALGVNDPNVRSELYSRMPRLDERIKDPGQRVADAQLLARFLEVRVNVETEDIAKTGAQSALARLREVMDRTLKGR